MAGEAESGLERAARAIWEKAKPLKPGPWNDALNLWERASEAEKRLCRLQAQVALEALREPPPAVRALFDRDQFCGDGQLECDWPDIIDALLK